MPANELRIFVFRLLIVMGFAGAAMLVWATSNLLVLAFGGIVVASVLRALSDLVARHTPLSVEAALPVVLLLIVLALVATAYLVGSQFIAATGNLATALPEAVQKARTWANSSTMGRLALQSLSGSQVFERMAGLATGTVLTLGDIILVLFFGLYLAVDSRTYKRGLVKLVPPAGRPRLAAAIDAAAVALRRWLQGQVVLMILVGTTTGIGLWLMGLPQALSMGVVAGLLEFVPFVGPILSAVPAILLGFSQGPMEALWVTLFYLALHQIEGNLLMPMIQRWAVALPPALAVVAIAVFALLFGLAGVLFASPLMVVFLVLIQKLYIEAVLEPPPAPAAAKPAAVSAQNR